MSNLYSKEVITVKLDLDLIRELLLLIEGETNGRKAFTYSHYRKLLPSYSPASVDYHLKYLLDSCYVEGEHWRYVIDITPIGREYLNSVRNAKIWQQVKEKIHPLGGIALDIVADVGKSFIAHQLGL